MLDISRLPFLSLILPPALIRLCLITISWNSPLTKEDIRAIMDLRAGYMSDMRSLVTFFVHAEQVSRLYAVISILETVGTLVLRPIISKAFSWGLELGNIWNSMVYIVPASMILILGMSGASYSRRRAGRACPWVEVG